MNRAAFGKTDFGVVRPNNEDSIFIDNERIGRLANLFIIADGMGGHNAGEVASRKAVDFFVEFVHANPNDGRYTEHFLAEAARYANYKVYQHAGENEAFSGMGTTLTVCCTDNINYYYAHIGDSRLYHIKNGEMTQVTRDHTLVRELVAGGAITAEQARVHPERNVLTRALGTEGYVEVEIGYGALRDDETLMLCSDGLTGMVTDENICAVLTDDRLTAEQKVDKLIETANENGGTDNISVIIL